MTVFKAFLKILNKNKGIFIMYTCILIIFGGFGFQANDTTGKFTESKPDVLIVNHDKDSVITNNFVNYIKKNTKEVKVKNNEEARNDALFYRDVSYIIYIKDGYGESFLNGNNPEIEIKKVADSESTFAELIVKRYIKVANSYRELTTNQDELIKMINTTLDKKVTISVKSKNNVSALDKASKYYNFANYSIMACLIYIIYLILFSFNQIHIRKRTIISSMNYKDFNRKLLRCNLLLSVSLWLIYVILSIFLVGDIMFTTHGLLFILNFLLFTFCVTSMALFIGSFVNNKDAINGIINVVALGSSFLCGAFIPTNWLPNSVITIAHVLPSYYYINSNDLIYGMEQVNLTNLKPVLINSLILIGYMIVFIILNNIVTKKKRKIN